MVQNHINSMNQIDEFQIDDTIFNDTTLRNGYVGATLFRFVKGEEVPMRWPPHFPKERPEPTTTTTTESTTTANATATSSGNSTANASSSNNSSDTNTDTSTGRKKRQLDMSTGYNYINVDIVRY